MIGVNYPMEEKSLQPCRPDPKQELAKIQNEIIRISKGVDNLLSVMTEGPFVERDQGDTLFSLLGRWTYDLRVFQNRETELIDEINPT